ncbi:MAG: diaminopimelate epimerase [Planctomycetes bacterium]|nr:diaminopimelate epimerase [Planctomycetota bacterium]
MRFTKMHGIGNDFVVVNGLRERLVGPSRLARAMCDRRRGVGADGLILVLRSRTADLRMRMWNPDGSEAEMCGNGIRCLGKYAVEHGLTRKRELSVETLAGPIGLSLRGTGREVKRVRVDMGRPRLTRAELPMTGEPAGGRVVAESLEAAGRTLSVTCVSMGNPHCVVFVEDVAAWPVAEVGPQVERHAAFPRRTNVEFVQVLGAGEVRQRTWERGAGETLACGTGACATGVACMLNGKTGRRITNHLAGGDLLIEWPADDGPVHMTGAAEETFSGEW